MSFSSNGIFSVGRSFSLARNPVTLIQSENVVREAEQSVDDVMPEEGTRAVALRFQTEVAKTIPAGKNQPRRELLSKVVYRGRGHPC